MIIDRLDARRHAEAIDVGGRTPSRASSCFTASVTVERGTPRSFAASLKLRRSTTRVNTRMASNLSIYLFEIPGL
jgi:hypothetical protein